MEIEKRIYSGSAAKSPDYHFELHHIDYSKTQEIEEFPHSGEYEFTKGYVTLESQVEVLEKETIYARVATGERRSKKTLVHYRMFTIEDVSEHIHAKLMAIDTEEGTNYADKYSFDWLEKLIKESLKRVGETKNKVSEENRQRLQKALG